MEQFISESITPRPGSFDSTAIARGEPSMPTHFTWRDTEYRVDEILEVYKTSSTEAGSGEVYLRRHWWTVTTTTGDTMKIYCERQKNRKNAKARWFLYTLIPASNSSN